MLQYTGATIGITMVIIYSKTLEKKGVDDVRGQESRLELTMSKGTALFSCPTVEADRWRDLGRSCGLQQSQGSPGLDRLWGQVPEVCPGSHFWGREADSGSMPITNLIRDLRLGDASRAPPPSPSPSPPAAPPSKRQCRSLSLSAWRPQGSRVWTPVEKRRCHSGGSAQRSPVGAPVGGSPAMQRSSSFSLPARSNGVAPPFDTCSFSFSGAPQPPRPIFFSLSHELIGSDEPRCPSPPSSPESTPEVGRRRGPGGLSRSRSQPCVLNDRKTGMKRRRPGEGMEERPSLDLAKMTQKLPLRTFQSLSCPGISGPDSWKFGCVLPSFCSTDFCGSEFTPCDPMPGSEQKASGGRHSTDNVSSNELDGDSSAELTVNGTEGDSEEDIGQLGGELDIEQIERN